MELQVIWQALLTRLPSVHLAIAPSEIPWRANDALTFGPEHLPVACPASLWKERLWRNSPLPEFPPQFAEFWYITFHALVWLDTYLSGVPEEDFAPPAPFAQGMLDSVETLPERAYTKEELRAYLASTRQKCHTTLVQLSDEQACQPVEYPWSGGQPISFLELQLYNLRHIQEHAAQLSLFLGQHAIPDEALDWVSRAKG